MFLSSEQDYLLVDFFQTFGLFLGTVSKQMFLLADTKSSKDMFNVFLYFFRSGLVRK